MGKEASNDTNVYITLLKVNISSNEHLEEKSTPVLEILVDWSKQPEEEIFLRQWLVEEFSIRYVDDFVVGDLKLHLKSLTNQYLLKYPISIDAMYKVEQELLEYLSLIHI